MRERTEPNFYFINGINGSEEITIEATVHDYRDDDYLPVEKKTIDCHEIKRITTTVFSIDFEDASVDVCGIFMDSVEQYLGCKWESIEKMVTDLHEKNYPVAGE